MRAAIPQAAIISDILKLDFRFAVDHLCAGYAGISAFTLLEPDFVKPDRPYVEPTF